jgi:hypothetical protein
MVDKIKHIFIVLVLPTKSVFQKKRDKYRNNDAQNTTQKTKD